MTQLTSLKRPGTRNVLLIIGPGRDEPDDWRRENIPHVLDTGRNALEKTGLAVSVAGDGYAPLDMKAVKGALSCQPAGRS